MSQQMKSPLEDHEIAELLKVEHISSNQSQNIAAKIIGTSRKGIYRRLQKLSINRIKHPSDDRLAPLELGGELNPTIAVECELPSEGQVKRYVLTSAQNNTRVHKLFWQNLLAYCDYVDAELLVGTFTYSHNNNSKFTVKRGLNKMDHDMWWDSVLEPYLSDQRKELAPGLFWCGDWNIIPTAKDPMSGLDDFNGNNSNIFPHSKLRQKSIPTQKGLRVKRNITTGTVTQINYVQRKAGQIAEFNHVWSAIVVEVDHKGNWLHRQLTACPSTGTFYDIDIEAKGGVCTVGEGVEAIIHGDLHVTQIDQSVFNTVFGEGGIVDTLKPKTQVLHDVLDFKSRSHHETKSFYRNYKKREEKNSSVKIELQTCADALTYIAHHGKEQADAKTVVVYSNHDDSLIRWLDDPQYDFRKDLINSKTYVELMHRLMESIEDEEDRFSIWEWSLGKYVSDDLSDAYSDLKMHDYLEFLVKEDDSLKVRGIEVGKHGHCTSGGARGTLTSFRRFGSKYFVGHYHKADIEDGAWSVGTYQKFWPDYHTGMNTWVRALGVIYPNGQRSIIEMVDVGGAWKWRL